MNQPKEKPTSAFSLPELLVSISILSILVILAYLNAPGLLAKARDAKRKADLNFLSKSLEDYNDSVGTFPLSLPGCGNPLVYDSKTHISNIPCDPKDNTDYIYDSDGIGFRFYTNLENKQDSIIRKTKCHFGCGPDCQYNYGVSSANINLENCLPPIPLYACSPGGGQFGTCEQYDDPYLSQCPQVYPDDPTCNNQCGDNKNRCENSSGKHIPE